MSTTGSVERDERTVAVENASYRWGFILVNYALLIDVMYRGIARQEAAWDLLALVIVSGAVCTIYQARQKALGHGWAKKGLLIAWFAGIIGAIVAAILTITQAM
jgi:hypothetical protein